MSGGVLVDSNILIDVLANDSYWAPWSEEHLARAMHAGTAAINPIIYAEVCRDYDSAETVDAVLPPQIARLPLPYRGGFYASAAFRRYRERGGQRTSPLPDFYIGAHAQVDRMKLLTRDVRRFETYFPAVELIRPPEALLKEARE